MENSVTDAERARIPTASQAASLACLNQAVYSLMGHPIALDDNRIVVAEDWVNGGTPGSKSCSIAAQPDVPRNLTALLTDANSSCSGVLTIAGVDPMGRAVIETMSPDGAGAGKTLLGTKIFARVDSVSIAGKGGTTSTDQIIVGVGNVIGTAFDLTAAVQVRHVYLGGARVAAPTVTTGVSLSGIDVSGTTYDGSKALLAVISPGAAV